MQDTSRPSPGQARPRTVGGLLREHRTREGMTIAHLSARARCTPGAISASERGDQIPTGAVLGRLLGGLGLGPDAAAEVWRAWSAARGGAR
ncbi:helix-turn-helix domain-containing protein [Nocardiopsis aegyptia]|uniref:helix-turn-helix domain-containing protein n=1 Tax=Nocardiopsis aegyptia TaxID=220378 RepID=UPI0015CA194D